MTKAADSCCCVCGVADARALVEIRLTNGVCVTLCGSHAVMHRRGAPDASSAAELRALVRDRRGRRDRRQDGDELGAKLTAAFSDDRRGEGRRAVDRRGASGGS